jgi:diguanylate cyclase (GGDEF)-like protein
MLAAWYGGKPVGIIVSIVSAGIWLIADLAAGHEYASAYIPIWNTFVRFIFFIIILWLLVIVREKLQIEEMLAYTDPLTGLSNRRFFHEQLEREFERLRRYPAPITIAYFDLDNFKYVNDTKGHNVGDELLVDVTQTLTRHIRASDFAARIGGDEFAILFPLMDKEPALAVLEKFSDELQAIMKEKMLPVTISIGAITLNEITENSRDILKHVDDLMYDVKKSGKNNIRHLAR